MEGLLYLVSGAPSSEMRAFSKDDAKVQHLHTALWACVGFSRNKVE